MANNEFGGSLYRSQRDMLDAIGYAWLGGGDVCGNAELEALSKATDQQLAFECMDGWELDRVPAGRWYQTGDETQSHMAEQGYAFTDLVKAFARLRERLVNGEAV